jgi:hypothetical protein
VSVGEAFSNFLRSVPLFAKIIVTLAFLALAIFIIVQIATKINKTIKGLSLSLAELRKKLDLLTNTAWKQMYPLNILYDWGMSAELIHKTIPLITMDPYFDIRRYDCLHSKYGLESNSDPDSSVLFAQSGEIIGNPFLLTRILTFKMGTKAYEGILQISWTETVTENGKTRTIYRTQTLTASIVRPYPTYSSSEKLIYGNEAAPNLSFSRVPSKANRLNEKQIEKMAYHESKKIEKLSQKSISNGGSLTAMSNDEFDGLFQATNRNDEVQFRLLFTPLAQKQIVELIKDKSVGYGDDFTFIKSKCLNIIIPNHLANQDIYANPNNYVKYDLAEERQLFNEYNNNYFKMFYFALAPILSIPLYQQYKPEEFIYKDTYPSVLSCWEHEAIANSFNINEIKHPESITGNILKTSVISSTDGTDEINITAKGFKGIERIELVSVLGGDGRWHNVPVHWIEYFPVQRESHIVVKTANKISRADFIKNKSGNVDWKNFFSNTSGSISDVILYRSLMAFYIKGNFDSKDNQMLNKLFATNEKKQ